MNARIVAWSIVAAVALACGGCGANKIIGKYEVVDIEKALEGIKHVPAGMSNQVTLAEYRDQIRKRYAGKALEFTADHPHEFLLPVPLEGTVRGLFNGGWKRDEKDENAVLIYQWVSGSMYLPWGRATVSNKILSVTLDEPEVDAVLFLRKTR